MFKGGSHWVSARMSAGNAERVREAREAVAVALEAEVKAAAAGDEPNTSPLDVPVTLAAREAALDAGEQAPARPVPLLAPANFLKTPDALDDEIPVVAALAERNIPEEALAHEAPDDEPRHAERPAPAVSEAAASTVDGEAPMPKFLDEPEEERSSARQSAWVVLSAVAVLTAFVLGALGLGLPDAGERLATLKGAHGPAQAAELKAAAARLDAPYDPEPVEEPNKKRAERDTASRMSAMSTLEQRRNVSPLRFRDAVACSDAVSCGVPLWAAPRREVPASIEPALGAAVAILNRARLSASGRVLVAGVPAVEGVTHVSFLSESEAVVADERAAAAPIALGDIGQVEIVLLPRSGSNTGGAQVALRERDGNEVARFDLKITQPAGQGERAATDEDGAGEGVNEDVIAPLGPPAAETPSVSRDEPMREAAPSPVAPAATPATASGKARKTKGKVPLRRAKQGGTDEQKSARPASGAPAWPVPQDSDAPARQSGAAPAPRGLFTFELPSANASQFQAAPVVGKAHEVSPSDFGSQRTPLTVDRAPGMETLMGLGGGFGPERP